MSDRIEAIAAARVETIVSAIAASDLPPGLIATREKDVVTISGRGLVRALADDARLRGLAGAVR